MWSHLEDVYIFNNAVNSILIGHHKEIRLGTRKGREGRRQAGVTKTKT